MQDSDARSAFPKSPTGTVMYYFAGIVVSIAPLTVLNLPIWLSVILIIAEFVSPWPIISAVLMVALYSWSFFVALCSPFQGWLSVYYYLSLCAVLLPLVISIIKSFMLSNRIMEEHNKDE